MAISRGSATGGCSRASPHGRHRYFRIAGPDVADLLEALGRFSPPQPVRSLREGTRAEMLRTARTCYDHLAGRLGTALMQALLDRGVLAGGDGTFQPDDRLSAPGSRVDYHLTPGGAEQLARFGVDVDAVRRRPRPLATASTGPSSSTTSPGASAPRSPTAASTSAGSSASRGRGVRITDAGTAGFDATFRLSMG